VSSPTEVRSRPAVSSPGDAVRTVLRGIGQTLITLGVVVLLFCVYELYFTNLYTDKQQSQLDNRIRSTWAAPPPSGRALARVPLGSGLAVIWIPRIGMVGKGVHGARVVVEGVSHEDLKKGPGHYPGTALPGAVGNVVISGHRTTYGAPFNRVDELHRGDAIVLETRDRWFTYRVTSEQIVDPSAVEVTYAVPGQRDAVATKRLLTLTTCNPKYSARQRLIVHALLEGSMAKSAGEPPALTGGG
jgi:sortase A